MNVSIANDVERRPHFIIAFLDNVGSIDQEFNTIQPRFQPSVRSNRWDLVQLVSDCESEGKSH